MSRLSKRSLAIFIGFLSQPSIFLATTGIPLYLLIFPIIIRYSRLFVLVIVGAVTFMVLFYLTLISTDLNAFRESLQLFVDILGGYILYSYFKFKGVSYLNKTIEAFISFLFFLNLYLLFEFYTGARILMSLMEYITFWEILPSTVPKMSYIWANPNSAGFAITLLMTFYSCTQKKLNTNTYAFATVLLALISSKSCFALYMLILIYTAMVRKLNLSIPFIILLVISLIFFGYSLINLNLTGLYDSSSWVNRSIQLEIMFPLINFFPNGWPSEVVMMTIFDSSFEDTMAGIILYLYIFGYIGLIPIMLYLLIFIITRKKIPLVFICFLLLSLTISTLSVSGLVMISFFLIITINNLKNEELYL